MPDKEHDFVSISVIPIDVRVNEANDIEYTDAPERSADPTPEQVCQICFQPLDNFSLNSPCPGPKIPNTIEGMMSDG